MDASAPLSPSPQTTTPPPWHASLALRFAARQSGTALIHNRHEGPLRVQRVLHPEGSGVCEALMLHPPGGIAGGDVLDISVEVGSGAHALLSTPGAAKWYRSAGRVSRQRIALELHGSAALEWLPQETILFDGADASQALRIGLQDESATLGWDIVQLGRPASGDDWPTGRFRQHLELSRNTRPVWIDRADFSAVDAIRTSITGLAGFDVFGTLWAASPRLAASHETALQALREALETAPLVRATSGLRVASVPVQSSCCIASSWLPEPANLLLLRALGNDAQLVRERLETAWRLLRPFTFGREAKRPRIWAT